MHRQTVVLKAYDISVSKRQAYFGCKRAFKNVYGTWEGSFAELSRFMEALKHFNPETVVNCMLIVKTHIGAEIVKQQYPHVGKL